MKETKRITMTIRLIKGNIDCPNGTTRTLVRIEQILSFQRGDGKFMNNDCKIIFSDDRMKEDMVVQSHIHQTQTTSGAGESYRSTTGLVAVRPLRQLVRQ